MLENLKKNHSSPLVFRRRLHVGSKLTLVLLLVIGLGGLSACYEDKEGCLDLFAVNYDVTADIDCVDCCTYPMLSLQIIHQYDTSGSTIDSIPSILFRKDSLYTNALQQDFVVKSANFYIRNIHLTTINNKIISSTNQINLPINDGTTTLVENNIHLVTLANTKISIPNITPMEDIKGITFEIGLGDIANQIDTTRLDKKNILKTAISSMYDNDNEGYYSGSIIYARSTDTLAEQFTLNPKHTFSINLTLPENKQLLLGTNNNFTLRINYEQLFYDFDFDSNNLMELSQKWQDNIYNSLDISR